MERVDVQEKLTLIFRKTFDNDSLVLSDGLTANDIDQWDSLTHMQLIAEVEDGFSVKFKLKELNKMRNVGDMIDLVISKLSH
ncbi:MAG: acyl carrier protein [Bacteroidales bacterium]|nr:acyl carrier protein [Bacteroidales bacterium]